MRIMEIVSGTGVNGAVINCLEIAKALHVRGHQVTMLTRPNAWVGKRAAAAGIEVLQSHLKRYPSELKRVADDIRKRQIDVVHTHMSSANFFGVILRRILGIRNVVASAHNRYFQLHWMFNDRVIAVSEATRKFHCRYNGVAKSRIDVVHNFIDQKRFQDLDPRERNDIRNEFGFSPEHRLIGIIGDVIPRKGLIHLVRALPEIVHRVPNVQIVCGGKPNKKYQMRVKAEAENLGVDDYITWLGLRDDVARILAMLDVYALPSLEENLPLSILEAMACGIPVVASAVGGIPECVLDGTTGFLVPPANPKKLGESISTVLCQPQLAQSMGHASSRRVQDQFSIGSQVEKIETIFQRMVA